MISLGEIARLAGVRSHLEAPQKATSEQAAARHPHEAVFGLPKLVEPQPIAPVQLNTEKIAERSASATNLYDRALRDSDRQVINLNGKGSSRAREAWLNLTRYHTAPINRSTSTPPEAVRASAETQSNVVQDGGNSNSMPLLVQADQLSIPAPTVYHRSHPEYLAIRAHGRSREDEYLDGQGRSSPTVVDHDETSSSPRENDPSPRSQASTSIAPEHRQSLYHSMPSTHAPISPATYMQQGPVVYSSASSPTYISRHPQHAAPQGQHVYAYHSA